MMRQWLVDAFADAPFRGNPACVVEPFEVWPQDAWMQALAQENNQAETAFLLKTADSERYGLRWFTPVVEVPPVRTRDPGERTCADRRIGRRIAHRVRDAVRSAGCDGR
jgi:hypothetical protein